jgi:hypothetical protein
LPPPPPPPTDADLPIEEPPDLAGGPPPPHGDAPIEMAAIPQSSEMALRPRVIVHPRVPEKIIQKLKIDDAILLQALVGQDGRVHQVRVLRPIDNCEECTKSAIEAAQQFSYDPPPAGKGPAEVWTTPFEIRFSYRR